MVRACGLVLLLISLSCGAPRSRVGMTMPSPEGCFVRVWDEPNFSGASDYINGPRVYPNLRDMPGARLWRDRIESAKAGPTATVTVWSDENFRGKAMRLASDAEYPRLADALTARIESATVECARVSTQ